MGDVCMLTATGRLTADSTLKLVGVKNTSLCSFSIASNVGFGTYAKTNFLECNLWGKQGESIHQYLKKGKQVAIAGELQSNAYTGRDGVERKGWAINVNSIALLGDSAPRNSFSTSDPRDVDTSTPRSTASNTNRESMEEFVREVEAELVDSKGVSF